jgi:Zn-dependent metalloprotease
MAFARSLSTVRRLIVVATVLVFWLPVQALVPRQDGGSDPRWIDPPQARLRAVVVDPGTGTAAAAVAREFLLREGGEWRFEIDRGTGLATLVSGSGIPLIPGRGNSLPPETIAGLPMPDGDVTLETLEPLVRAFIDRNRSLLVPGDGILAFDRESSAARDGGRLFSLYYQWTVGGVPVEHARVFVRVNSGNITQFGAPLVGTAGVPTDPALGRDEAVRALHDWAGDGETARLQGEPRLVLQPENDLAGDLRYRLTWIVRYRVPGEIETWEGRIDAGTGQVIGFRDVNAYGRVRGGVYPRTVIDEEITLPMPFSAVAGETTVTSDAAGFFTYTGGEINSGLDGQFFTTNCEDGCSNPPQAALGTSVGIGFLDFGLGGVDAVGNGASTKAERNSYYHLNQVRRIAKKWLDISWLDSNIVTNVNIDNTCNAFWDGSANFYRSGGGCNNTGEISDVMQHEWGHGFDGNTRSGDGATGEGTADAVAMTITHDARIGPYFRTTGAPVRDLDKTRTSKGLLTRSNVLSKCQPGTGPLGAQVHCEGEIYGQSQWDLSQALVAKHGHQTGWRTLERIFYLSAPDAGSYLPDQSFPIYDAYLNADDDDGNLTNGTPNGDEIYNAFNEHEIAGSPVGTSPACTRPTQPTLTVATSCDRFDLSWSEVAGVDRYEVFRAVATEDTAYFPVATLAAGTTGYSDFEVMPGVDYYYVVMSVNLDGCESTVEGPVQAILDSQPILSVSASVADDTPRGNRSGFPDPGEEVDLSLTLTNFGDLVSSGVSGTISTSVPGVTILDDNDTWPDIAPGAEVVNQGVLRFETDDAQLACGDSIRFELVPDEASGCAASTSFFDVTLGDREVIFQDQFETDQGWSLDVAASTAAAGDWTRGDPDGTGFQPEDDVTADPGVECWFTAPNGGGVGTDDIDDGVTVLVSPIIDLSGLDRAILSYYRWFANRDLGEDAEDFFKAEVSDNAGASWVNLETLGTNESAASWTRREFNLEEIITLTNQVQIRFMASDGVATGNLIEAAVDEVRIVRPVCDDTPACYVEPTFDGLANAVPGASCGETDLAWSAASTNCQNATISYNIYRSTDPGFLPDDGNRIATGLEVNSYLDTLLEPGVTYHYIVRAYDSRSGEDSNLERRTVTSPTSPDIKPPVFGGLESAAAGGNCGETVLTWSVALETCNDPVAYEVYRSTDPGFVPAPSNRIASTLSLGYVDPALVPGTSYTYVVRARDEVGNVDANDVRFTVSSAILDKLLTEIQFEPDNGGWSAVAPNDATTGNWDWGDPTGTSYQPEDDHTPDPGVNAWMTGVTAIGDNNDVDGGTTTLLSAQYDLSAAVDPVVRYARWFTNDRGNSPGEDPLDVEVSNDDGANWTLLEQVGSGTPLEWVEVEYPLVGTIAPTGQMRFRFTARDLGEGSLVEAGVDDFALLDRDQGCAGCATPAEKVTTILVDKSGDDVVIEWTADPVSATRYVVYKLTGSEFEIETRIGSTDGKTFVHEGAMLSGEDFYYRISAIDTCGNESLLE